MSPINQFNRSGTIEIELLVCESLQSVKILEAGILIVGLASPFPAQVTTVCVIISAPLPFGQGVHQSIESQ